MRLNKEDYKKAYDRMIRDGQVFVRMTLDEDGDVVFEIIDVREMYEDEITSSSPTSA
jgi:hypothetical protein